MDNPESNIALIDEEISAGVTELRSRPYEIQFSPEHRCNLRCIMCSATVKRNHGKIPLMDRKLPDLTLERFRKLEADIPLWRSISLTGSGEPLMSPALDPILAILKQHEVNVSFNTNASFINRQKAEMLVRNRVDSITISVDAACRETYEKIRQRGKWEKLLRSIDTLNQVKDELRSELPRIAFAGNFMRQNVEELPDLVRFAHRHRGFMVLATNTEIYDPAMDGEALVHHRELTRRVALEATRVARELGIAFDNRLIDLPDESGPERLPAKNEAGQQSENQRARGAAKQFIASFVRRLVAKSRPLDPPAVAGRGSDAQGVAGKALPPIMRACQKPWTSLMVASDGKVKVCCYKSPVVGNLNEQTLEDIWNGDPVRRLRRAFLDGRPPEGCRNCFIFAQSTAAREVFVKPMV